VILLLIKTKRSANGTSENLIVKMQYYLFKKRNALNFIIFPFKNFNMHCFEK